MLPNPQKCDVIRAMWGLVYAIALSWSGDVLADPIKPKLPKFAEVEKIVQDQFKKQRRKSGELISQGDVKPIFDELAKAGWKVADQADILKQVPTDGSTLVKQFRTPSAKGAMQGFGNQPGVYDRLDRMVALPDGQQFLRDVLSWPNPSDMLRTLTTTDQGADLADSLTNGPRTKDFTKPTGLIYTPQAFLARLRQSHEAAEAKSKKSQPKQLVNPSKPGP